MSPVDNNDELNMIEAKLAPARIRSTLAFAGLYQMTHEMLKRSVIQQTKAFFGYVDIRGGEWIGGDRAEEHYRQSVLARAPKKPFEASLKWLAEMGAIDGAQAITLDRIYDHRHELTHELAKYIVDVAFEPNTDLFLDALSIFKDLDRFWIQMEMEIGTFDEHKGLDLEDVTSGSAMLLDLCIQAYTEGLSETGSADACRRMS
jgi:hypothetical protein